MRSLYKLCRPLLGIGLLALPGTTPAALAQTTPKPKTARKPAPQMVPNTTPAARAADPLRGTNPNPDAGQSGYAAPGEPLTPASSNGKNTPSYKGPAPKPAGRTHPTPDAPN